MPTAILHNEGRHRDLLPDAIGSGLKSWLRRGNGLGLLAFAALGWLGLISWELPVAGQSASGSSAASHFAGRLPTTIADFLLQSFGIAAVLIFAVPTFWGIEQLARQRLENLFLRLVLWPTSVLAASGALSALPAPANWPFARGLGGVVGDQLFAVLRLALSPAGQTFGDTVAGGTLAITALALFVTAIGASRKLTKPAWPDELGLTDNPDLVAGQDDGSGNSNYQGGTSDYQNNDFEPQLEMTPRDHWHDEPQPAHEPSVQMAPPRKGHAPAFTKPGHEPEANSYAPDAASSQPIHVPYDDPFEDDESRRMARRFAPAGDRDDSVDGPMIGEPSPWFVWKDLFGRAADAVAPLANAAAYATRPAASQREPLITQTPAGEAPVFDTPPAPQAQRAAAPAKRRVTENRGPYRLPASTLLAKLPPAGPRSETENAELMGLAKSLETVLIEFGVRCQIVGAVPGPIVTQFEIQTAPGTKTSRVIGLAEDIARSMGVRSARVAPVPARSTILIELPKARPDPMALRDLLESKAVRQTLHALPLPVGIAVDRQPIVTDLATVPGLLIVGAPGTGKSKALSGMLTSLLLRFEPADLRLLIIDPRYRELPAFDNIAHLAAPVISQPAQALAALQWCVEEMEERLKAMSKINLRGIGSYNNAVRNALRQGTVFKRSVQTGFDPVSGRAVFEAESFSPKPMPYLVVVIDDLDVVAAAGAEPFLKMVQRLAQGGRSAGIHILASTSRLDSDLLPRTVTASLSARICLKTGNKAESRAAIGDGGAELLVENGDFLFSIGGVPVRGQAPMLMDGDVSQVVEWVQGQADTNFEPAIAQMDLSSQTESQLHPGFAGDTHQSTEV